MSAGGAATISVERRPGDDRQGRTRGPAGEMLALDGGVESIGPTRCPRARAHRSMISGATSRRLQRTGADRQVMSPMRRKPGSPVRWSPVRQV